MLKVECIYIFFTINICLNISNRGFHDPNEIVLLPSRDRRTDYWFCLRVRNCQLILELMGPAVMIPLEIQPKANGHQGDFAFLDQLPFGFIRGDKV